MPSPTTSSELISLEPTGNILLDALTAGGERWKSATISYSFPDIDSFWSTDLLTGYGPTSDHESEPWNSSFEPIFELDQTYFIAALQQWENIANIHFVFVQETSSNVGDIRIAYTHADIDAQAWTYLDPDPAGRLAYNGDIWVEITGTSAEEDWTPGSYSFITIMHEIGHTLGLEHPFENSSFPVSLDTMSQTIMSYSAIAGDQSSELTFYPTTPMPLDILAIQHLYGQNNSYHSGDDNYFFHDSQTYHETIWDSGGTNDWLGYSGNQDAMIDLREGMGSYIGNPVYAMNANAQNWIPNIWIAYDTVIENALAGSGNDILMGNEHDNTLSGEAGNDDLDGQEGTDVLFGGMGNDILRAGYGNDVLEGDSGNDTFGFYALGHFGVIDFTIGEDLFFFDAEKIGVNNLGELKSYITNTDPGDEGVTVDFGPNASITLVGINLNEITAGMIVFTL